MDRDLALEALSAVCKARVTSVQKLQQGGDAGAGGARLGGGGGGGPPLLSINRLVSVVLDGDHVSPESTTNVMEIRVASRCAPVCRAFRIEETAGGAPHVVDDDDFFDHRFDRDFTNVRDTQTYSRGGEPYRRPCGWYRFGLKVLDKYEDNSWLGNSDRSTESVPGEWPVSYHGTSMKGANCIIEDHYKAGPRQLFGRGVYSTPDLAIAECYSTTFTSPKTNRTYKVLLQNRINPEKRRKVNDGEYWLVPIEQSSSAEEEQQLVEQAIRPYGLLLKPDSDWSCCQM